MAFLKFNMADKTGNGWDFWEFLPFLCFLWSMKNPAEFDWDGTAVKALVLFGLFCLIDRPVMLVTFMLSLLFQEAFVGSPPVTGSVLRTSLSGTKGSGVGWSDSVFVSTGWVFCCTCCCCGKGWDVSACDMAGLLDDLDRNRTWLESFEELSVIVRQLLFSSSGLTGDWSFWSASTVWAPGSKGLFGCLGGKVSKVCYIVYIMPNS